MNASYIQGETITAAFADDGYSSAVLNYGSKYVTLSLTNGEWTATINSSALSGRYNYAAIADGHAIQTGSFVVRVLVSKYRAVLDAIDEAMQGVAANGKYSVSVGEISLQDKTFAEMLTARNYYARLADAEEAGTQPLFGPKRVEEVYA